MSLRTPFQLSSILHKPFDSTVVSKAAPAWSTRSISSSTVKLNFRAFQQQRLQQQQQGPQVVARSLNRTQGGKASGGDQVVTLGAVGLAVAAAGLGFSRLTRDSSPNEIKCEVPPPPPSSDSPPRQLTGEPESIFNLYELSFGAVCGICAGVFIKKGAKIVAFLLGGAFVFLQYLNSMSYVSINWPKISSVYDRLTTAPVKEGEVAPKRTVGRLWGWLVNFLTADFQQRATFLGGLALGLRLG